MIRELTSWVCWVVDLDHVLCVGMSCWIEGAVGLGAGWVVDLVVG